MRSYGPNRPAPAAAVFCTPAAKGAMSRRGRRKDGLREKRRPAPTRPRRHHPGGPRDATHGDGLSSPVLSANRWSKTPWCLSGSAGCSSGSSTRPAGRYERQHRRHCPARGRRKPVSATFSPRVRIDRDPDRRQRQRHGRSRLSGEPGGAEASRVRAFHLVTNVVICHHWPRFLDTERRRPPAAWLPMRAIGGVAGGSQCVSRGDASARREGR